MKIKDLILGAWKLSSFIYMAADGKTFYPYGQDAAGILMYDKSGYMTAFITRRDRPMLANEDYAQLTDLEKISLSKGVMAYSGRYEILADRIIHHLEQSFIPNWVGTRFERFCRLEGGQLLLSTPPALLRGKEYIGYLSWHKAED